MARSVSIRYESHINPVIRRGFPFSLSARLRPGVVPSRRVTRGARCACRIGPIFWSVSGAFEQPRQLLNHRARELVGIHDRYRATVVARDVVTDTDCD